MSVLVVIDCEMSGPRLTKHAMFNLGATIMDLNSGRILNQLNLIINIPEGRSWDNNVINWMLQQPKLAEIYKIVKEEKGLDYRTAMDEFVGFMKSIYHRHNDNIVIGGDHLAIDIPWIDLYLSICDYDPLHMLFDKPIHLIDISSFHQGCSQKTHQEVRNFSKSGKNFSPNIAAFKHFNINYYPPSEYTHCAIDDSRCIAETHFRVLKAMETLNNVYVFSSDSIIDRRKLF